MSHNETHNISVFKPCEVYTCDSKEECDDKLFGLCKDLTISMEFPTLVLSSRHSDWGMARFLMDKCTETGLSTDIFDKCPLYFANAFKSQPDSKTIERIISEIQNHDVKYVLLDNCVTDPLYYSLIANLYEISIVAIEIKGQNEF